ncbi:hypothetical protein [Microbispora rosea]|uniref:hypothetical protein n=1 Tax=Microbispora rosea TaxID=58117 RepID=UPI0037938190
MLQTAYAAVTAGGSAEAHAASNRVYLAADEVAKRFEKAILTRSLNLLDGDEMTAAIDSFAESIREFASIVRDELAREEGALG